MAWMGSSPREAERAFVRARQLCEQTGNTSQLCWILGQLATMGYVRAEYRRARELGQEALSLAQQSDDPLLVALGHWHLGFIVFGLGEYTTARAHLEKTISFYEPRHHRSFIFFGAADAGLSALAYDACSLWCLGYPEQASKRSQEALALAREVDHPFSLADVLCFAGCMFNEMRRDAEALQGISEELLRLASEKSMPTWLGMGTCFRGEAMVMLGNLQEGMARIREGIEIAQANEARLYLPRALGSLAQAQAKAGHPEEGMSTLDEALALLEETGERHWEAELHRLRAELLLAQGADAEAEPSLQAAIGVARGQQAKSWELRAATSLARLWQKKGKTRAALELLEPIYGWFTEGFDTRDLKEARTLLDELS
jgi:predicted ATPase